MRFNNNPNYIDKVVHKCEGIGFTSSDEGINLVKDAIDNNPFFSCFYNEKTEEITIFQRGKKDKIHKKMKIKVIAPFFKIWKLVE